MLSTAVTPCTQYQRSKLPSDGSKAKSCLRVGEARLKYAKRGLTHTKIVRRGQQSVDERSSGFWYRQRKCIMRLDIGNLERSDGE